jgi:hypothetical protein
MTKRCDHSSSTSTRIAFQEATLSRQLEWVRSVDSKVPVLLGISAAMLGAMVSLAPDSTEFSMAQRTCMVLAAALLVWSQTCCALAVYPRTEGPGGSLVYFGTVAEMTRPQYIAALQARTDWDYLSDLQIQTHRNAQIAALKFRWTRRAHSCISIATIPWSLFLYLL